jgi:hypothetical protein
VKSEAFLQYLNNYQFVGVRFFAARIDTLCEAAMKEVADAVAGKACTKDGTMGEIPSAAMHRGILPLFTPPLPLLDLEGTTHQLIVAIDHLLHGLSASEDEAKSFLDGFYKRPLPIEGRRGEPQRFELWLRGLLPDVGASVTDSADDFSSSSRLKNIAEGMESWAFRVAFRYWRVSDGGLNETESEAELSFQHALHSSRPVKRDCDSPIAARLALLDFYYLARLLRAEVTPSGVVSYRTASWLASLCVHATLSSDKQRETRLRRLEEILRSVFSLACELVQNAAELREQSWDNTQDSPGATNRMAHATSWRCVQDEELAQVSRQRRLRSYKKPDTDKSAAAPQESKTGERGKWSHRLYQSGAERDLIGLALSGGGNS